jgi:hypothetical protein
MCNRRSCDLVYLNGVRVISASAQVACVHGIDVHRSDGQLRQGSPLARYKLATRLGSAEQIWGLERVRSSRGLDRTDAARPMDGSVLGPHSFGSAAVVVSSMHLVCVLARVIGNARRYAEVVDGVCAKVDS